MTDHRPFASILERLLCSLVDEPRSVELEASRLPGRVNFAFNCDVSYVGKIVGRGGVRLRMLRLIVEIAGRQFEEEWKLDQPDNPPGERRIGRMDATIPDEHNPEADFALLAELLTHLGVNASLSVSGEVNSGFLFTLVPAQIQDNTALLDPYEAAYSVSNAELEPLNLISCLGAVFRAIGAVQGCRYQVQIH